MSQPSPISMAFFSYLAPISSSRALKWVVLATIGILGFTLIGYFAGLIPKSALEEIRAAGISPGLPIAAALMSEMAIRDGITHRTLLYPILGPVPRVTLAVVRTLATAMILALFALGALLFLHVLSGRSWGSLPLELLAVTVGSLAYVCLFGLVHLWSKRGLVGALGLFGIFDHFIGILPFEIRKVAPSYHLRRLGDANETLPIPISLDVEQTSVLESTLVLLLVAVVSLVITAFAFRRKSLGDLC